MYVGKDRDDVVHALPPGSYDILEHAPRELCNLWTTCKQLRCVTLVKRATVTCLWCLADLKAPEVPGQYEAYRACRA